jgi:hypothetical protein
MTWPFMVSAMGLPPLPVGRIVMPHMVLTLLLAKEALVG